MNVCRDRKHAEDLDGLGWRQIVIWECQLKQIESLRMRLAQFLAADQT